MTSKKLIQASVAAFQELSALSPAQKNKALRVLVQLMAQGQKQLLRANQKDLQREQGKLSAALYQRLKLDEAKLGEVMAGIRGIIKLPDPAQRILSETQLDDGLHLQKVSVPLGVIGVIFESRPDVMPQVLSLMLKSGNAVILKGGSEARHSNQAFLKIVRALGRACPFLPRHWAQLIVTREAVHDILNYPQDISLIIPRGSNALVRAIMQNTKIPVLGHADGICHLYIHADANLDRALEITLDSKTQYPSACNALETLLVHRAVAKKFLPRLQAAASAVGLELRGCSETKKILSGLRSVRGSAWATEYGELILAVKIVESLEAATGHIAAYGSGHTDGIVATNEKIIEAFLARVDSAGVFANASTRFADGFRYGFGAEVGVSTGKLHARGPVGLDGLCTYKYKLRGRGQVVVDYMGQPPRRKFKHRKLCGGSS